MNEAPQRTRPRLAAALAAAGLAAAGCGTPAFWRARDVSPPVTVPEAWSEPAAPAAAAEGAWWKSFGSPELDELVARALSDNLRIGEALARLERAEASMRRSFGAFFPDVGLDGQVSRSQSLFFAGEEFGVRQFTAEQFVLAATASYELDFWKRVASGYRSGEAEWAATRDDLRSARITIAGEVVTAWLELAAESATLDLLERQSEAADRHLELMQLRFTSGLSNALEVYRQRQLAREAEARIPLAETRVRSLENRLAVLVGEPPGSSIASPPASLPPLPEAPSAGVPLELVRRRPDVRAAESRAVAARYDLAAAIADRFPAVRLTGRVGYQGFEPDTVFDNWIYSLAANLAGPIVDGGRRRAAADASRAAARERLFGWGRAILAALEEVENLLVEERQRRRHVDAVARQLEETRRTRDESLSRYRNGLHEYLPVLDATQTLHRVEQAMIRAEADLLTTRVRLHRALAGDLSGAELSTTTEDSDDDA